MSRAKGLSSRQRALPAAAIAASVVLYGMVKILVSAIMFSATSIAQSGVLQGFQMFSAMVSPLQLWVLLPLGLGIIACLWFFAPVTAELRLSMAIVRSLLAVASGVIVVFLAQIVLGMQGWFANAQFFGNSSNQAVDSFFADGGNVLPIALNTAVGAGLDALPVVLLAVVLTWIWLVKHPVKHSAIAVAAEV
ncbi:MAG: hypothetical protein ABI053_00865 [Lacisediminihabitans sp.]